MVVWGSGEGITWEDLYMEEFIMMERNFKKGALDFQHYFKKTMRI